MRNGSALLSFPATLLCLSLTACAPQAPGRSTGALAPTGTGFLDGTYDGRAYKLYVPAGATGPTALVVMLHGCEQTPATFAAATSMNTLADSGGFLVVYPEQPSSDNALECWSWYLSADQVRGSGEPAAIAGIVGDVQAGYDVDAARIYVAGFSAGGGMAVILGATYPDLFSAIAVDAGLEFGAATALTGASGAQSSGGPSPVTAGQAAYAAMGAQARVVRTQVVHGAADQTVALVNGTQVLSQWAETDDLADNGADDDSIDDTADTTITGQVTNGHAYTTTRYTSTLTGDVVLEKIIVEGLDHDWSGGVSGQSYTDASGPDASKLAWSFFSTGAGSLGAGTDGGAVGDGGALIDAGGSTDGAPIAGNDLGLATTDAGMGGADGTRKGGGCSAVPSRGGDGTLFCCLFLGVLVYLRRVARPA